LQRPPLHSDNQTIVKEKIFIDKANPNIAHEIGVAPAPTVLVTAYAARAPERKTGARFSWSRCLSVPRS
jgi:hypothetical protein